MIRKILINIFTAFVIFPFLLSFKEWGNIFNGIYKIEDAHFETFKEYFFIYLRSTAYPILSILFLIIILMPFQLIKDYFYGKGKPLSLFLKCTAFLFLFTLSSMIFARGYLFYIVSVKALIFFVPVFLFGVFYPLFLFYTIDKYVERK